MVATVRSAPSSTRYCFPPERTTAYTALLTIRTEKVAVSARHDVVKVYRSSEWGSAGTGEAGLLNGARPGPAKPVPAVRLSPVTRSTRARPPSGRSVGPQRQGAAGASRCRGARTDP